MSLPDEEMNRRSAQDVPALLCLLAVFVSVIVIMAQDAPDALLRGPGRNASTASATEQIARAPSYASDADVREETAARFREQRLAEPAAAGEVTLTAVGDIMLSRTVAARISERGQDYPFREITPFIKSADIAFGNLETPIVEGAAVNSGEMSFRSDPGVETELAAAGFDVLSLANNHTPNRGQRGLESTEEALQSAKIAFAGEGMGGEIRPAVIEAKGTTFAFLAYTDPALVPASYGPGDNRRGTAFMDVETVKRDVAAAAKSADVVIVSMHAGNEYQAKPDRKQVEFAHAAIDAGASAVIGHHPHVVQSAERYKGGLILYSLGNFIFDQDWSRDTRDGLAARLVFSGPSLVRAELYPVSVDESQPRLAGGDVSERVLSRVMLPTDDIKVMTWDGSAEAMSTVSVPALVMNSGSPRPTPTATSAIPQAPEDGFVLEQGRLRLMSGGEETWSAPDDAWVDSWQLTDIDGDGAEELAVSAWLPGKFGESKPFWETDDPSVMTNRLLIYDMEDGLPQPRWFSSGLPRPNCLVELSDLDGDGAAELIAYEGDYADAPSCQVKRVSVWRWKNWGFVNLWAGQEQGGELANRLFMEPFRLPS